MELTPVFIVFIVFASIVAVLVGPSYLKTRERGEMQQTVRNAIDKGQTLPPELIEAMTKDVQRRLPSRTKDLRHGVIWLAIGVGLAGFGLISDWGGNEWNGRMDSGLLGIACIPATIGVAFIILSFFNPNKD